MSWFDKCKRVPWQPPNAVFKYVWPILYFIYGLVMFLQRSNPSIRIILIIGLLLNLIWVPVYVWSTKTALIVLSMMIATAVYTELLLYGDDTANKRTWKHSILFAPYIAWLLFAFSLNAYLAVNC